MFHTLASAAVSLVLSFTPALAAPPTDEQVDAFVAKVTDATKDISDATEKYKVMVDTIKANMDQIAWSEISIPQLEKLASKLYISPCPDLRATLHPRLLDLSKLTTPDGARGADLCLGAWPNPKDFSAATRTAEDKEKVEVLVRGLTHPAAADLFKAGKGQGLLRTAGTLSPELMKEHGILAKVEAFITSDLSPSAATNLGGIFDYVTGEKNDVDKTTRERVMAKIAVAATAAAGKEDFRFKDDPKMAARISKNLKDLADQCTSAFARGELMDHQAPPIKFTWSNSATPINSFADFKGKVVIVDFWATWCGPCRASFPKLRQLAERYKEYPVVILGVTSDQGYHIACKDEPGNKPEKIDCDGDPAKEHELMKQFIKDMNMTWTVAFSDKSCFNPDFGVRGIPHIAVITPDGKVRQNGLRPGNVAHEAEMIDKILEEFKLPKPSEPIASKDE